MPKLLFIDPAFNVEGKIAIIGSSGSLTNSNLGKIIDGYDTVVRFNRAPIKGYENDVGNKTSLRICNLGVFLNKPSSIATDTIWSGQPAEFIRHRENENILFYYADKFDKEWKQGERDVRANNNVPYKMEYLKLQKKIDNDIKPDPNFSLSVGVGYNLSIGVGFTLLCVFSNILPVLFGFDINILKRTHYWEPRPGTTKNHNISFEQHLLKKLRNEGKIEIRE